MTTNQEIALAWIENEKEELIEEAFEKWESREINEIEYLNRRDEIEENARENRRQVLAR